MDDETLLECVRKYPILYDITHPKYMDNKFKNAIWQNIAQEMNQTEDVCKRRWITIRDNYKKNIKRKTKTDQVAAISKKSKYEENFNLPCVQEQSTNVEIENKQTSTIFEPVEVALDDEVYVKVNKNSQQCQQLALVPDYLLDSNKTFESSPKSSNSKIRHFIPQSQQSASGILMDLRINEKSKENIHPIDAFLNSLSTTLKSFSPHNQHVAKGKLFAIVHELEGEQLSLKSTCTSTMRKPASSKSSSCSSVSLNRSTDCSFNSNG